MIITSLFPHNYCSFHLTNNFMMRIAVPRISCKIPCSLHQIQSLIIFIQNSESMVGISPVSRQESNTLHKLVAAHLGLDGQHLVIDHRNLLVLKKESSLCKETSILSSFINSLNLCSFIFWCCLILSASVIPVLPLQCWHWGLMVCPEKGLGCASSGQAFILWFYLVKSPFLDKIHSEKARVLFGENHQIIWLGKDLGRSNLLTWAGTSSARPGIRAPLNILERIFFLFYPSYHLQEQVLRQWRNTILWIAARKEMQDRKGKAKQNTNPNHLCLNSGVNRICLIPAAIFSLCICSEIMGWILSTLVVAQQLIYS